MKLILVALSIFLLANSVYSTELSKSEFEQYFTFTEDKPFYDFPDYSGEEKKACQQRKNLLVCTVKNYKINIVEILKWQTYANEQGYLFALVDFDEYPGYFDEGVNLLTHRFQDGRWIMYNKTQYDRLNPPIQYMPRSNGNC